MHATPGSRLPRPWLLIALAALGVIALAVGVVRFAPSSCALSEPGPPHGEAVFYNPVQAGDRCSIGPLARDGLYVSLPAALYGNGTACGAYLDVTGPRGRVRAEIVDMCPGCGAGQLDLSSTAFTRIQAASHGAARVSWQLVSDPALPGPLAVRIGPGSYPGPLTVQILNHGNPLSGVQVDGHPLVPRSDGYWIARTGNGNGPFTIHVTDTAGHNATLTGIALRPGVLQQTRVFMYGPAMPSPAPIPSPAPLPSTPRTSVAPSCRTG